MFIIYRKKLLINKYCKYSKMHILPSSIEDVLIRLYNSHSTTFFYIILT